ncbi:hypothetical protein [Winogradskyella poriferorum]|uniref:hypothetical protein n=1 Tax=Winogradskyella poriferorum TaxID=307627 RepID=UPI003D660D12
MKTKTLLQLSPEIYLVLATLYYWFLTANLLNPFAIFFLVLLAYQIYTEKFITGVIIASLLILINLYLVLALFSELAEFPEPNSNYNYLLIFGSLFIGLNLVAGIFMFFKYIKTKII